MENKPPIWIDSIRPAQPPTRMRLGPHSDLEGWVVPVRFELWKQPDDALPLTREETYGWKAQVMGSDGSRSVGEVEIVRRMRVAGYKSYWIDTFGSAPAIWKPFIAKREQLPSSIANLLAEIQRIGGRKIGGAPDVVAWRESDIDAVFIEYKGPKDKIRDGQDDWVRSALQAGLSESSYCIAKWDGK